MTNKEATKFGIETLEYMRDNYPYLDDERKQALNFAIKALEERPQGEWIFVDNEIGWDKCSNCEWTDMNCHSWNYCPNCGAKMDGKEEEE